MHADDEYDCVCVWLYVRTRACTQTTSTTAYVCGSLLVYSVGQSYSHACKIAVNQRVNRSASQLVSHAVNPSVSQSFSISVSQAISKSVSHARMHSLMQSVKYASQSVSHALIQSCRRRVRLRRCVCVCSLVYLCMYADAELDCEGVLVCSLVNAVGQ